MAQSENPTSNGERLWREGSLSIDELERLAGSIKPSWEVGLDAVGSEPSMMALAASEAPVIKASSTGFTAAPAGMAARMNTMMGTAAPLTFAQPTSPSVRPAVSNSGPAMSYGSVRPGAESMRAGSLPREAAAILSPADISGSFKAQQKPASKGMMYGLIGAGLVLVIGIAAFAMRGSPSAPATARPEETTSANVVAPTPPAAVAVPEPIVAAPAPVVAAPVIAPPGEPAVVVPTEAAVVAPVVIAPAPAAAAPVVAARNPEPEAPPPAARHRATSHATRPEPAATHSSSAPRRGHRPAGVGFVTDSPY